MLLLTLCKADFELDFPCFIMHIQRNQGVPRPLHLADKPFDLLSVQQQLARTNGIRLDVSGSCQQGTDMAADKKQFTVPDDDICFLQLHPSRANRLHFPSFQNRPRFMFLLDKVVMKSFLILDDAHSGILKTRCSLLTKSAKGARIKGYDIRGYDVQGIPG